MLGLGLGLIGCAVAGAQTGAPLGNAFPIRFGILPIGGALESRTDWEPLVEQLGAAMGRPVSMFSATSYEALADAIADNQIDVAFLSGKLALDTVTNRRMVVVAQVTRHDGLPGYRAVLLASASPHGATLEQVLREPELLRLARGESRSMSGYIVPKLQFFLPNHIAMETRFASEQVGTHQTNALAVANGEADVATNNTADLQRFKSQFPTEHAQLRVIWESELIPHAMIVARREWPAKDRKRLGAFFAGFARGTEPAAQAQRAVLKSLHDFAGFIPADDRSLEPTAVLTQQLARQSALEGQWVSEQARQARLDRIDETLRRQIELLREPPNSTIVGDR